MDGRSDVRRPAAGAGEGRGGEAYERIYNTALPTSEASERVFSTAGDILTDKRSRLSPDNAEKLLIIKENLLNFKLAATNIARDLMDFDC